MISPFPPEPCEVQGFTLHPEWYRAAPLKRLNKFGSNFDGLDIGWDKMMITLIQYLF
jgi:hypothetical protein